MEPLTEFDILKVRLLLRRLDEIPNPELHALVMQEANAAAALARQSGIPLLAFPCLFEERTRQVAEGQRQQLQRYWRCLEPGETSTLPNVLTLNHAGQHGAVQRPPVAAH